MAAIIKRFRDEKTRGIRATNGFINKLMIPDSEIPECPESEVEKDYEVGNVQAFIHEFKKKNQVTNNFRKIIIKIDNVKHDKHKIKNKRGNNWKTIWNNVLSWV